MKLHKVLAAKAVPIGLSGSLLGSTTQLTNSSGVAWFRCEGHGKGGKIKGEVTGAKTASLTAELTGCKDEVFTSCQTVGSPGRR